MPRIIAAHMKLQNQNPDVIRRLKRADRSRHPLLRQKTMQPAARTSNLQHRWHAVGSNTQAAEPSVSGCTARSRLRLQHSWQRSAPAVWGLRKKAPTHDAAVGTGGG